MLHRYDRAAVLVALALIAAACSHVVGLSNNASAVKLNSNGLPVGAVSAQWITKQPLSHLYFPGSKPFYVLDSAGPNPAYAGAILTSNATGAQVYSWHIATLKARGWSFITDNGCTNIQPSCPQFGHNRHGQRESFYLAVDNPALLPSVIGKSAPAACTVYEIRYEVFPSGGLRVPAPMQWNGGNQCWWSESRSGSEAGWHTPTGTP